ncbi:MAG TPA: ankyrin repeat domain-containing protein [Mycobacteriales bacterium]|nr:ankyrin repeat domain-containing protein [Mycobacteriales bacterium]
MTDVFQAVAAGDTDAVSDLLRSDRDCARARNGDGITVVLWALYVGQPALAKVLAHAKRDLDVFETAALGETDRLGALLDTETQLAYAHNADGYAPLHLAAFFGWPTAAQRLLTAGADVDEIAQNSTAVAPLHSAAAGRHPDVVRVLLDAGARVDVRQQGGWTPLHSAAQNADAESVELLLAAGADALAVNDAGHTPADLARGQVRDHLLRASRP